ncbi:MAG: toxin [Candidatus Staskawiczbacteria bacterium]|nr:toxin [Candidatus Staskawiczbacteria bacterium]
MLKCFNWNTEKNKLLMKERRVSFEMCLVKIENKAIIDILLNKNYPNQKIFVIEIDDYVHLVPFVETEQEIFLKTIIPSRKFTKKYLKNE